MKLLKSVLLTLLTFDISQTVLASIGTVTDQIADESKFRDYGIRVKAPSSFQQYEEQTSFKKYETQTQRRKPPNRSQLPKVTIVRKKDKKRFLSQTASNDTTKQLFQLTTQPTRPERYNTTTHTPTLPDPDDSYYNSWMPIIPIFQRETHNDSIHEPQNSIPHIVNMRPPKPPLTLIRRSRKHTYRKRKQQRKRGVHNIAMKRANSFGFSDAATDDSVLPESDASESHRVEYRTKIKHHHHHHHHKYVETVEKKVPVKVIVHKPYPVEKKVPYPVEKVVHKYIEKKVPYPVEKKVPYPVEVKVPQPYPVKVIEKEYIPKPYPVVKHVPIVKHVEVKVPVTKLVPYPVEKKVPYPVEVKVPYPVEKKVPYAVEVEKKVPYPVKVYIPKPYPVEKKVPYPVEVKVKEPYPVVKHVPVPVKIYVDKPVPVPVPKPYPVEVEKKVPYPVEVEKKVHFPVYVPQHYSVDNPTPLFLKSEIEDSHPPELFFSDSDLFNEPF